MTRSRSSRAWRSTSTPNTTMPTGSERNGRAPSAQGPVAKGGSFDLGELQRLANEMFRALPGGFLPGIDPEQPASATLLPADAEPLRPRPETPPSADGHVDDAAPALPDVAAGVDVARPIRVARLIP